MKELSIEKKAKRYDEALTKARNIVNSINVGLIGKDSFEAVFPELKESEDERIRKAIIEFFELQDDNTTYSLVPKKDIIAWLEKQGEQKSAWSEEDEKYLKLAIDNFQMLGNSFLTAWLKSLKERYIWKPSDEQITWLYRAADDASKDSRMKQILNELLSDLKKLKGE